LQDDIIRKIWPIFADYLFGCECEYTASLLRDLSITVNDLPTLEDIFMDDVAPVCQMYDPLTHDNDFFSFTEETIAPDIEYNRRHPFLKKIFGTLAALLFQSKKDYYKQWLELKNELLAQWEKQQ
jgi:hypothetical protein